MKTLSQVINEAFYGDILKRDVNVQIKVPTAHPTPIYNLFSIHGEKFSYFKYDDFKRKLDEFRNNKLTDLEECNVVFKVMIFDDNDYVKGEQLIDECIITMYQLYKDGKPNYSNIASEGVMHGLDDGFKKRLAKQLKKEFDTTTGLTFQLDPNAYKNNL